METDKLKTWLWTCSGENPALISQSEPAIQRWMARCGGIMLAVTLLFLFSFINLTTNAFSMWLALPASLLLTAIFAVIYLLLVIALPKPLLPTIGFRAIAWRAVFIRLLAILLLSLPVTLPMAALFSASLIAATGFRESLQTQRGLAVILEIVFIALMVAPFFIHLVVNGRESTKFYTLKRRLLRDVTDRAYDTYLKRRRAFAKKNGIRLDEENELFIDPPYNTIRKPDARTIQDETDFLNMLGE